MSEIQADVQATNSAAPAVSEAGESTSAASPSLSPASSEAPATDSSPSLNASPGSEPSPTQSTEISRDSLMSRLHAKLDALEAKIASGVVVFAHEVAEIRTHIKAVL
jgi:hypothetical protein